MTPVLPAPAAATRTAVWRAQQCLQEWQRLQSLGLTQELGGDDNLDVQCLDAWSKAVAADLLLVEALRGSPLAPLQALAEVLPTLVQYDATTGQPSLPRPVSKELVGQLQGALAAAAPHASPRVVAVAEAVAVNMQVRGLSGVVDGVSYCRCCACCCRNSA